MLSGGSVRRGYINCIYETVDHFPTVIKIISLLRTVITKTDGGNFAWNWVEKVYAPRPNVCSLEVASLGARHFEPFHKRVTHYAQKLTTDITAEPVSHMAFYYYFKLSFEHEGEGKKQCSINVIIYLSTQFTTHKYNRRFESILIPNYYVIYERTRKLLFSSTSSVFKWLQVSYTKYGQMALCCLQVKPSHAVIGLHHVIYKGDVVPDQSEVIYWKCWPWVWRVF